MRKLISLLIAIFIPFVILADSWKSIGKGFYQDPIWQWSEGEPVSGEVDVEEDIDHPGIYRFKQLMPSATTIYKGVPTNHLYINCENHEKVFFYAYSNKNTNGDVYSVSQVCKENNFTGDWFGTGGYYSRLDDRTVTVPESKIALIDTDSVVKFAATRPFIFKLPSNGDPNMKAGMYFGLTAFNYLPKFFGIHRIDESNVNEFVDFINSQELDEYTYLYYSVDQAIDAMINRTYPSDLKSVALITFTDGNDDGSLAKAPDTSWTDIDYQKFISKRIKNTYIQEHPIEAFSIGLKGNDVGDYNYDLFKSNLIALASDSIKATEVTDMADVERTLNSIIDQLQTSWVNKTVQIRINMRGTGDRLRFTLDKSRAEMNNNPENSDLWIEGVFNREDLSLSDLEYHGLTSTSGLKVIAHEVVVNGRTKYQFVFNDLRDINGNILETGEINFWHKNSATPVWQPHTEFGGSGDVITETEYSSAAIMLVMDCSSSLGRKDFAKLKEVVTSITERLAGRNSGVENIFVDELDSPVIYYNLQGIQVENPTSGLYIKRQGRKAEKVLIP